MTIKNEIENAVIERCNCAFSSSAIYSGEFSCQESCSTCSGPALGTYVIYRARINGTSDLLTAPQLMQHIDDWRTDDGTLLYNFFRLRLSNDCDFKISSFKEKEWSGV